MCVKRVQEPGTPLPSTLFKKPFQAVQQSIISFLFIVIGNIAIIFKLELLNSSFGLWKELQHDSTIHKILKFFLLLYEYKIIFYRIHK